MCKLESKNDSPFQSQTEYLSWRPADSCGLQEDLLSHFSVLTLSSPEVAGVGVGKKDVHISLCHCPSFLVPSFCWTQPILFLPCHLWLVNVERGSNHRNFRGKHWSPFPTVLLIEWWVSPGEEEEVLEPRWLSVKPRVGLWLSLFLPPVMPGGGCAGESQSLVPNPTYLHRSAQDDKHLQLRK